MRIGHGYDAHTFVDDRPLILGGVTIPYEQGLLAHSDGDAVIHALCDALLGGAALGDIWCFFPDTSKKFENIDSRILLRQVKALIDKKNLTIVNADITILAQAPKMSPHILRMRENISQDIESHIDNINIKATTTEKMGFVGRKEGIAVHAVVLLE